MDVSRHIAAIREEGERLAAAAAATDLDTPIPTCPEWRMRDLVQHLGGIHRWAALTVRVAHAKPSGEFADIVGELPGDADLVAWFREGVDGLAGALDSAPADLECWSFLPAPSPLAFWARRQAHETAIHRVDGESPGAAITPFSSEFGADGIDELVMGFASRRGGRLRADPPRTLAIAPVDAGASWLVRIGPEGATAARERGEAECTLRGSASDLYVLVWNRRGLDGIEVDGDAELPDLWRRSVQVRFG